MYSILMQNSMDLLQENAEKILMLMINLLFVAMIIIARSQFLGTQIHDKSDTATLLMDLLKHHDKDPDYIVYPRLERPSNELTGLFANNTMNSADYEWILCCTLKATNNLIPLVLFTDEDLAMIAAIHIIYLQTRHLLCIYHISKNIKKKARSKLHVFTAGVESTQQVESINDVFKKHLDRNTLLKKLGKVIEQKLENESQYTRIKDYYGSNPSSGLPLTYFTIFKDIDSVLKDYLSPIPLSLQQVQIK
ncbi:protein FAR1-RELATED SEQUENCE 5-like [Rhizophagus irregularis DAOM 181602=DAOM 197198]|nr:protein FAR1-RELATED SEQUENCE 5-like [Rhizophagus irregularis DAOM 181602=DAOM 197198]